MENYCFSMDGEHKFETFSMDLKKTYIQVVRMMATMRKLIWADVSDYECFWRVTRRTTLESTSKLSALSTALWNE